MSKAQINYSNKYDRVIALIDMDCKYKIIIINMIEMKIKMEF